MRKENTLWERIEVEITGSGKKWQATFFGIKEGENVRERLPSLSSRVFDSQSSAKRYAMIMGAKKVIEEGEQE